MRSHLLMLTLVYRNSFLGHCVKEYSPLNLISVRLDFDAHGLELCVGGETQVYFFCLLNADIQV